MSHRPRASRRAGARVVTASLVAICVFTACATYQSKVSLARQSMLNGTPSQAAKDLEPLANEEGKDQLVYLLDYATVLQQAGRYKESATAFQRAERIADIQDYHSLSKVTSSLVLSEDMIQYKGDDYEKVLIHAVNSVNYLEQGDLDGALVEVRKLNNKLYKYKYEAKRDYEQNPFAFYLSALIWEADRKYDDAYIAFKKTFDLIPDFAALPKDLIRASIRAQRTDELETWQRKFPQVGIDPVWSDRSQGEVVLVYMQGWGPRKYPRPDSPRFPYLEPVPSITKMARFKVAGGPEAVTQQIFSVQDVAIKTLEDDHARLVASRLAGVATKAVLADQIRQNNEVLGDLAWVVMNVADQADLRQWSTLPETFQVARISLPAGSYEVQVEGLNSSGAPSGEEGPVRRVQVRPRSKTFISWRSVR